MSVGKESNAKSEGMWCKSPSLVGLIHCWYGENGFLGAIGAVGIAKNEKCDNSVLLYNSSTLSSHFLECFLGVK